MESGKKLWQSKTFWFNVATGLISIGTEFMLLTDNIPEEYRMVAIMTLSGFVAVGNIILRYVTSEPIE